MTTQNKVRAIAAVLVIALLGIYLWHGASKSPDCNYCIQPNVGIGPISFGDSPGFVKKNFGSPTIVIHGDIGLTGGPEFTYRYANLGLDVQFRYVGEDEAEVVAFLMYGDNFGEGSNLADKSQFAPFPGKYEQSIGIGTEMREVDKLLGEFPLILDGDGNPENDKFNCLRRGMEFSYSEDRVTRILMRQVHSDGCSGFLWFR